MGVRCHLGVKCHFDGGKSGSSSFPFLARQVEEFRQRMTEEWQRHAKTHGNPYFGDAWIEGLRRIEMD